MADYDSLHEPHAPLLRAALEAASPAGAAVGLDLGCGRGGKTPWLAARCGPAPLAVGLDVDRAALRAGAGPRLAADAHALPLRPGSVGLIWAVAALGALRDPALALAEARRALRPGGALVAAVAGERWVRLRSAPGAPPAGGPLPPAPPPPADGLGDELREALAGAGLRDVALAAYLLEPPGLGLLAAALPLAELGGEPGEPEPRPVLLVAVGYRPPTR
jgi:SAM-dependent methyltransferase